MTEDPNIATLRTFLGYHLRGHQSAALSDARQGISALASTLAERDRRIAELTRERDEAKDKTRVIAARLLDARFDKSEAIAANQAPPAPAPGELAEALRHVHACMFGHCEDEEDNRALTLVHAAAEAHLAHLRAPKGELEEARAELGAWLAGAPGWFHSTFESVSCTATPETAWSCRLAHNQGGIHYSARGPTEAAAIRAALSRARGEGS